MFSNFCHILSFFYKSIFFLINYLHLAIQVNNHHNLVASHIHTTCAMKSLKNLWKLFPLSALLVLAACSADDIFDLGDDAWSRQNLSPAITEAREFFEDRIAEADLMSYAL